MRLLGSILAGIILLSAGMLSAQAHPLAPALLELRELEKSSVATHYAVSWRSSISRAQGVDVIPVLPPDCSSEGETSDSRVEGQAVVTRWRASCGPGGLTDKSIRVAGIGGSAINVILRIEGRDGQVTQALLGADQPSYVVVAPAAQPPVFMTYLKLGIEHLLFGFDHVLFVLGLLLLVRRLRLLVLTITAFTLGHSITLSLAVLGFIHINPAVTELGIALSILWLAVELMRPAGNETALARRPWLMAVAFGLLHGLGFAGALAEIGLPQAEIPLALFSFNVGIEAGQLMLVTALLVAAMLWRRLPQARMGVPVTILARLSPVYVIGTLAAFWCFERAAVLAGFG